MHFLVLLSFLATAHARAVNISNTWVLPEEGFPVFYRYFRDRISWYEADAVCQFHHANLVTVDTTAQYDAVRAYLRELDITSAVWVGLIRSNPEGEFTWTDYRGLSGDGYWSSAPDPRTAPLCAAADPSSDYRWEARACGGPIVASFICELPVPQWALGKEGCMVRALPALTILYLPESAAVQLTADCGLAGVKRLQCVGNVKREDLLRDLSCTEEVDSSNSINNLSMNISTTADVTTITENLETINSIITEEDQTVEQDNSSVGLISTLVPSDITTKKSIIYTSVTTPHNNDLIQKNNNLNIMENNNLQSNDIPNSVNHEKFLTNYRIQEMEDEDNMQHKKLHDELARLGNFETIFTQPTDHFVPPLVIAKARLNDDMTELSLEEKHAQHFGTHKMLNNPKDQKIVSNLNVRTITLTEQPIAVKSLENFSSTEKTTQLKEEVIKSKSKNVIPKKYIINGFDPKGFNILKAKSKKEKLNVTKIIANENNSSFVSINNNLMDNKTLQTSTDKYTGELQNDSFMDLTVTLRENEPKNIILNMHNETSVIDIPSQNKIMFKNKSAFEITQQVTDTEPTELDNNEKVAPKANIFNKSIITDDIISVIEVNKSRTFDNNNITVLDITTKMPVFKDDFINSSNSVVNILKEIDNETKQIKNIVSSTESTRHEVVTLKKEISHYSTNLNYSTTEIFNTEVASKTESAEQHLETTTIILGLNHSGDDINVDQELYAKLVPSTHDNFNTSENIEDTGDNTGDLETIDDYQSPLLSGANEPVQRPIRSRRPKSPPNRINKFNPFRILG